MKPLLLAPVFLFSLVAAACGAPTPPPTSAPVATQPPAASSLPPVTSSPGPAPIATPTPPPDAPTLALTAQATAAATATLLVATSTANPTVAGGLVGMWQGNNNSFYLLNIDGTWSWDQKLQQVLTAPENTGRWWLEGDIFRIQDTAGRAPCPPDQVGSYQVLLSGDVMTLTAVADRCGPRIDQTEGQYSRQPAGP